ncbi:MAG: LysM peptidoglycan-binding domain-containing protein [Rhodospirillaceae bacterium]
MTLPPYEMQGTVRRNRRFGPSAILWTVFFGLLVSVGIATVGFMVWETRVEQGKQIAFLLSDRDQIQAEQDRLRGEVEAGLNRIAELEAALESANQDREDLQTDMDEFMVPREIGSPADFPIERAMAKPGETLADFATREGTTEEVLRALNPWLDGHSGGLKKFQTLWIPISGS